MLNTIQPIQEFDITKNTNGFGYVVTVTLSPCRFNGSNFPEATIVFDGSNIKLVFIESNINDAANKASEVQGILDSSVVFF